MSVQISEALGAKRQAGQLMPIKPYRGAVARTSAMKANVQPLRSR